MELAVDVGLDGADFVDVDGEFSDTGGFVAVGVAFADLELDE